MGDALESFQDDYRRRTAYTDEHDYVRREWKCKHCGAAVGALWGNVDFYRDGKKIGVASAFARGETFRLGARVKRKWEPRDSAWMRLSLRCRSCGNEWQAYKSDVTSVDWTCNKIDETERFEEPIGEDTREISNDTSSSVTRTLRVNRQWTSSYTVESTEGDHREMATSLANLTMKVGSALEEKHSVSFGETHTLEEEISITVPPRSAVTLILAWKRIWQAGTIDAVAPDGHHHTLPFRAAIALTFDQRQTETAIHDGAGGPKSRE